MPTPHQQQKRPNDRMGRDCRHRVGPGPMADVWAASAFGKGKRGEAGLVEGAGMVPLIGVERWGHD